MIHFKYEDGSVEQAIKDNVEIPAKESISWGENRHSSMSEREE